MKRFILNDACALYEIGRKTIIVDLRESRKSIVEGNFLGLLKDFKTPTAVGLKNEKYIYKGVNLQYFISRRVLLEPKRPLRRAYKAWKTGVRPKSLPPFGIDLTVLERKEIKGAIEITPYVRGALGARNPEYRFLADFFKVTYSPYSSYQMLTKGLWNQYLNKNILKGTPFIDSPITSFQAASFAKDISKFPISLFKGHLGTFSLVQKFRNRKINVLIFDAHLDYQAPPFTEKVESFNFINHLSELDFIESIYVVGIRGIRPYPVNLPKKVITYPIHDLKAGFNILTSFSSKNPYYVSFDMDFIDGSVFQSVDYPVPGGFSFLETLQFFDRFASSFDLLGLDIVEFNASLRGTRQYQRDLMLLRNLILSFAGSASNSMKTPRFKTLKTL